MPKMKRTTVLWLGLIVLAAAAVGSYFAYQAYYLPNELRLAASKGDVQAVQKLIAAGADVNRQLGLPSNSVLNRAIESGKPELVKMVLQAGADPNAKGETGMTALMMAAFVGNPTVIDVLLAHQADPTLVEDRRKDTALLIAINRGHTEAVTALLKAKVDPNRGSEWGRSPLCEATSRGMRDIEKALIDAGAKCPSAIQK